MSRGLPPHMPPGMVSELVQKLQQAPKEAVKITSRPLEAAKINNRPLGRQGLQYLEKAAASVKPEEQVRITARRMLKAERDERVDITHALTPVKQYMAGFTRPTDLRTSNWFPGGTYISRSKVYESPVEEAYLRYTVFMLESRYNIRYGVGRVESPHYVYGVCLEQDLPALMARYNSPNPPNGLLEYMDNARWPGGPQQRQAPVKWWTSREELQEALDDIAAPLDADSVFEGAVTFFGLKKEPPPPAPLSQRSSLAFSNIPAHTIPHTARTFHSSSAVLVGGSDNDDHVVPDFYVQSKQGKGNKGKGKKGKGNKGEDSQTGKQKKSSSVIHSFPGDSTRKKLKMAPNFPTEFFMKDGIIEPILPPSNPTSTVRRERDRDFTQQTAAVAERVLEEDFTDVSAETSSRRGKVPFEVRGEDGTVTHPSGFEPPTAADDFEHSGNHTVDSHIGQQPTVLGSTPSGLKRGLHTSAVVRAREVEWDFEGAKQQILPKAEFVPRAEYIKTLREQPFWRPLLTLTVASRPIALTLVRLARGGATGTPFHTQLSNDDKKCKISSVNRMRTLRLRRMQDVAVEMGQVLGGMRGGVVGLRFSADAMGRGIGGEGLEDPVPADKRRIEVGVARWFHLAPEFKQVIRAREEDMPSASAFDIFDLDEFGNRFEEGEGGEMVPWREAPDTPAQRIRREPWYAEYTALRGASKALHRHLAAKSAVKQTPKVEKKPQRAASSEVDEDEDEMEFVEGVEDDGKLPIPVVLVRNGPNTVKALMRRLDRNVGTDDLSSFDEKDSPLSFTLATPAGQKILDAGSAEDGKMTLALKPMIARRLVQRRLDALMLAKEKELASVLAAGHRQIEHP